MALFKKKLEVVAAMRQILDLLLSRDIDHALSAFNEGDLLSDEEMARLKDEILLLEITLWQFRFLETTWRSRVPIEAEDVGYYFSIALGFALRDQRGSDADLDESIVEIAEGFVQGMGQYSDRVQEFGDDQIEQRGWDFLACQVFSDRVLPDLNLLKFADFNKHSEVFHIAKQVNDLQDQVLRQLLRDYKLVHTGATDVPE